MAPAQPRNETRADDLRGSEVGPPRDADDELAELVADFCEPGLSGSETIVIVAAAPRGAMILRRLEQRCRSAFESARRAGGLVTADATEILAKVMVGPLPDEGRLQETILGLIEAGDSGRTGKRARVYGEMADLLWNEGARDAALFLEEMWGELPAIRPSMLCAQTIDGVFKRALRGRAGGSQRRGDRARHHVHLQDATAALAAALTENDVARVLLAITDEVMNAAAGVVYLQDAEGQLRLAAWRGAPPSIERWRVLPLDAPLPLSTAVVEGAPLFISSREELLARYPQLLNSETPASLLQSVAALPLLLGDRVVGALAISFGDERRFDPDERRWLDAIVRQAALAADRARLYEAERRARKEAETLLGISASLNATSLDPETTVQQVTDEATDLIGAEFGTFLPTGVDGNGASTFAGPSVVRLDDVTKEPQYSQVGLPYGLPRERLVASYLAVPVVAPGGHVLGGMFFGHARPGRFTREHERLTKALAATAALAIDKAKLLRSAHEAEEAQRQLVDELRETVHVNDMVIGVLAHDLRSPLAAMITAAELVRFRQTASGDERNVKSLNRLMASGDRMARMIEQLLDFTRLRFGGGMTLEPKSTNLGALLKQVSDEVEGASAGPLIGIELEGDPTGTWDADRLGQLFSNLIGNAVQHGLPGTPVVIRLDGRLADTVRVEVHNKGAIPSHLLPAVFDPLTGGGERRRDKSRGLGLGLFITREIALAHAGAVTVASSDSGGTTFTVTLPRGLDRAAPSPAEGVRRVSRIVPLQTSPKPSPPNPPQLLPQEDDARVRLLVDAVKDYAIFMLDPTGHVVTWNAGAERIKGYLASEIIGQHFSRFYSGEDVRAGTCDRELEIAAREGRFEDEGWRFRKDGSRFWANVVITALRSSHAELVGFAKVTRDLTERRRLQQEQVRLAKAQEAIRLRDEFLSLASHELKTPLTVLQMQLESLRERVDPSDKTLAVRVLRAARSSDRLAALVESLLDVSRIATGQFLLSVQTFDLGASVARLVDAFGPTAAKAGCDLTLNTEGNLLGGWDLLRIEQLVTNLLSNATKYGAGRPIAVTVRRQGDEAGDHVILEVRDHGPGISEAALARIFGRFERAAPIGNYGGLGLGLYMAREIVNAHGGSVTAFNAEGGGACLRVQLPVRLHDTERELGPARAEVSQ